MPCAVVVNLGWNGQGSLRDCLWDGALGEEWERLRNTDSGGGSPGWVKGSFAEMEMGRGLRRDEGLALDV